LCGLTFVPVIVDEEEEPVQKKEKSKTRKMIEKLVYLENWKNKKYIIWTIAIPLAQFGYFVPYCHLVSNFFDYSIYISTLHVLASIRKRHTPRLRRKS
jgi:hypothetical protein